MLKEGTTKAICESLPRDVWEGFVSMGDKGFECLCKRACDGLSFATFGAKPSCSRETDNLIAKSYKWLYEDAITELGERKNQARPQNKKVRTRHGGHRY